MRGKTYVGIWDNYVMKQGNPMQFFKITNQTLSIAVLLLLSGSPTMEDHTFD